MANQVKEWRLGHLWWLISACLLISLTGSGCAVTPEVKGSAYEGGFASLAEDSAFYAGLLASIEPKGGGEAPYEKMVLIGPTYAAAHEAAVREAGLDEGARDFFARGLLLESQALTEVLRKRQLFKQLKFQEENKPDQAAMALAKAETPVIYLDLNERLWFYLPANGGPGDRLGLDLYLIHDRAQVRAWLAKLEEYLTRPALAKPEAPPASPPPVKATKRPGKSTAGMELRPAAFGLSWRISLARLRSQRVKLGPTRKVGDLIECVVESAPELPENTGELTISLHPRHGLQQIVWKSKPITGDAFGFLGREQFLNLQDLLEEKYGPASASEKFLDPKQFKARDQFYACLERAGCGSWNTSWKLNGMFVRLALLPVMADTGILCLTYQGPEWNAILMERERQQRQKLEKAL